jgi:hypothetical protein
MTQARTARGRDRLHRERGSVLVEAAILIPLLFVALFGIVEFGRLFFMKVTIENATREAGRFAVTGNRMADPSNPAKNLPRPEAIKQYLVDQVPGIAIDKSRITIVPADGGDAGDIIKITVEYDFEFATTVPIADVFLTDNRYTIRYTTVMKNEPLFTEKRRT